MDSTRVFKKYLAARIRAERLPTLVSKQRRLPVQQLSYCRLPAGGRLSEALSLWSNQTLAGFCNRLKRHKRAKKCDCQTLSDAASEPKKKPSTLRFKCKYKRPVLVVRSRPRVVCSSSESVKMPRVSKKTDRSVSCELEPSKLRSTSEKNQVTEVKKCSTVEPKRCPCAETIRYPSVEPIKCPSVETVEPEICPSVELNGCPPVNLKSCPPVEHKNCPSVEPKSCLSGNSKERHISFQDKAEPVVCEDPAQCADCNLIPQISTQLTTLMTKQREQLAVEIKQKEELNAINNQLKQLCGTVTHLNEKYKYLESETDKLTLERLRLQQEATGDKPCSKTSSMCLFCKNKNLPVLSCMHNELFQLMGKRLFTEVALTILLRADNIYHVNVRDLNTGQVLGCLLVNDAGIKDANSMGLFQEILTFCVIDVRSSMSNREAIFGGINFEFVSDKRLRGGHATESRKELLREMYDPICSLLADQASSNSPLPHKTKSESKNKPRLSVSQTKLEIGCINQALVPPDEVTQYPVSSIKIVSLLGSNSDSSIADKF